MIVAGCDVGSLSAEAVLLENGAILGSEIILVRPTAEQSARDVMEKLLDRLNLSYDDVAFAVVVGHLDDSRTVKDAVDAATDQAGITAAAADYLAGN